MLAPREAILTNAPSDRPAPTQPSDETHAETAENYEPVRAPGQSHLNRPAAILRSETQFRQRAGQPCRPTNANLTAVFGAKRPDPNLDAIALGRAPRVLESWIWHQRH